MMNRLSARSIVLALTLIALAACSNGSEQEREVDEPASTNPPPVEEAAMATEPQKVTGLDEVVDMARTDLADRLGIESAAVSLADAREVTWPNGALGCPEEGMMYTQALVDGFYVLLEAEGKRHAYHAGRDGVPFPCPTERSQPPKAGDRNPTS